MRRRMALAAATAMVLPFLVIQPTSAAIMDTTRQYFIRGTVTDKGGRAITGVRVDDGTQFVLSGPGGSYELAEGRAGTFTLSTRHPGTYDAVGIATVNAVPVLFAAAANFRLSYALASTWIDGPSSRNVVVASGAPSPGIPGQAVMSCVAAVDPATSIRYPASWTGSIDAGGSALWQVSVPLSTAAARLLVEDCASGASLGADIAPVLTFGAETATQPLPSRWVSTPHPDIVFSASDSGSGIDQGSGRVAVEGIPIPTAFTAGVFHAGARNLIEGAYRIVVSVADRAGNRGSAWMTLNVDLGMPVLSDPSPVGGAGATPRVTVRVGDTLSGVDPGSIRLVLDNGLVSAHLAASYDLGTGLITYQVPSLPTGPHLGQSPLAPGAYRVDAFAEDVAGNPNTVSWMFIVQF